jgi:hypothetical protein
VSGSASTNFVTVAVAYRIGRSYWPEPSDDRRIDEGRLDRDEGRHYSVLAGGCVVTVVRPVDGGPAHDVYSMPLAEIPDLGEQPGDEAPE